MCGLIAICLAVPMGALGADDCPPPSTQPFNDPGYIEDDSTDDTGGAGPDTTEEVSEDSGVLGSLGSMSSGQLTLGVMVIVGVVVGVVYLLMIGRIEVDEE